MLNGKYKTEHFVDDNAGGAELKLSKFLNRSNIEPTDVISITHAVDCNNRLSILLVYVSPVSPFDSHDMGMF